MAVKMNEEVHVPESTGAVDLPADPVTSEQLADNASTGAVDYQSPGQTTVDHYDQPVVVRQETPGPVTMSVSWLSEAEAKVVEPTKPKPSPKKAAAKAETK